MSNKKNKITYLVTASAGICLFNTSFAIHSTIQDAEQLRKNIIYNETVSYDARSTITKKIVLPISRGFDQKESCLCWSYAFFSALESLYLVKHPDSNLELSRGAMQYINLQDRIDLKIIGIEDHLNPKVYSECWSEGGTPLSADYILKNYGAVPYSEYHDIISPPDYTNLYYSIFIDNTTPKQKREVTDSLISVYFGYDIPELIHFNGQLINRLDFVSQILPKGTWNTYAISKDGSEYIAPGLDPDARRGEKTHFIARDTLAQKINQSITNYRPIVYTSHNHVTLIYGIDYNKNNEPVRLYIKDSYGSLGYYYKADFEKTLDEVLEMTMLE